MKTLASCKPSEFFKQTNRIRKSVEKWLTDTDIMNIRKRLPRKEVIPISATQEEIEAIEERNKEAMNKQMRQNFTAILDAVMEDHADETLEILALSCFIEPENVDDYSVSEYFKAFNELINDENVISFFTSLVRLAQTSILSA